jgi:hypothetical protein
VGLTVDPDHVDVAVPVQVEQDGTVVVESDAIVVDAPGGGGGAGTLVE